MNVISIPLLATLLLILANSGAQAAGNKNKAATPSVQKKESTYMFEVDGDSMIDAHIESGDMVIAERKDNAKDGDIVIALIDGEYTMKYLRKKGDSTWLEAANKNYAPLYPREEMKIVAVVKGVIRKY